MLMNLFTSVMGWIDKRLPVTDAYNKHAAQYPAPKNFNFWYVFGASDLDAFCEHTTCFYHGLWDSRSFSRRAFCSLYVWNCC